MEITVMVLGVCFMVGFILGVVLSEFCNKAGRE